MDEHQAYTGYQEQCHLDEQQDPNAYHAIQAAAQLLERMQEGQVQSVPNGQVDQHVMDQLMLLGQNLGSGLFKPEDYFAQLQAMNMSLANSDPNNDEANAAAAVTGSVDGIDDAEGSPGANPDKPLTSKFRGVCWNKKNKRWQAAINSSGKYIYLGSYVQEEEAARSFDKAAIRLRGNRAKLNYSLIEYQDEKGNFVEDKKLSEHLNNILGKEPSVPKPSKGGKSCNQGRESSADIPELQSMFGSMQQQGNGASSAIGNSGTGFEDGQQLLATFQQALMPPSNPSGDIKLSPHYPYNGGQKYNYGVLDVPEGCSLTAHIPGDEEVFAVLYTGPSFEAGSSGAAVWDGHGAIDLGVYDTDKDARQAAGTVLRLVMFYKHTLAQVTGGCGTGMCDQGHQHQQQPFGVMKGGVSDDGGLTAVAVRNNDDLHGDGSVQQLGQTGDGEVGDQAQYGALFQWLAQYQQGVCKEEDGGGHEEANRDTHKGSLKSLREEEHEGQPHSQPASKRGRRIKQGNGEGLTSAQMTDVMSQIYQAQSDDPGRA